MGSLGTKWRTYNLSWHFSTVVFRRTTDQLSDIWSDCSVLGLAVPILHVRGSSFTLGHRIVYKFSNNFSSFMAFSIRIPSLALVLCWLPTAINENNWRRARLYRVNYRSFERKAKTFRNAFLCYLYQQGLLSSACSWYYRNNSVLCYCWLHAEIPKGLVCKVF